MELAVNVLVIDPVNITDDELAEGILIGLLLMNSGCLMRSEHIMVARAVNRLESLLYARKFVRRLMAEIDKLLWLWPKS